MSNASSSNPVDPSLCSLNGHTVVIDSGIVPTCKINGLTQGAHCSVCNEVLNPQHDLGLYHIYLLSDIKYPSGAAEGKASFKCIGNPYEAYEMSFTSIPTEQEVYDILISFMPTYPEGMEFTNSELYKSERLFPDVYYTGKGCAAFTAELSDAAFGEWPGRITFDFSDIRAGDIIRLADNGHSVIVLAVDGDTVTIAEANYNGTVHWGRTLSLSNAATEWNYMITRYPI